MSDPILPAAVANAIQSLAEVARDSNLTTLEVEAGAFSVTLKRHLSVPVAVEPAAPGAETAVPAASAPEEAAAEPVIVPITSELVGRFLLSTPTGSAVRKGETVAAGDIVAYIESMTLMNEVRAPVAGRIVEILVEPGHPVEYGQVLLALIPSAPAETE